MKNRERRRTRREKGSGFWFKWEHLGSKGGSRGGLGLRVELLLEKFVSNDALTRRRLSLFLFSQEQDGATKLWVPPELGATVGT